MNGRVWRRTLALVVLLAMLGAACSSGSSDDADSSGGDTTKKTGPIKVGILTLANLSIFLKSTNPAVTVGDPDGTIKALVAEVNATGGLGGREIVAVFGKFDTASTEAYAVQEQAICDKWTQDEKVEVAVAVGSTVSSEGIPTCLSDRGVPVITQGSYSDDQEVYDTLKTMFSSAGVNLSRAAKPYVEGLRRAGFFTPGAKYGLVSYEIPGAQRAVEKSLEPALKAAGITLTEKAQIPYPVSPADIQAIFARSQTTVVKFRDAGVTHVLMYGPATFFMTAAERQQYRPKYGISSLDSPGTLPLQRIPTEQLQNATGIGWYPVVDVDQAHAPADNPATQKCKDLLTKAGIELPTRTADLFGHSYCDALLLLQAAYKASPGMSSAGVAKAVEGLKGTYRSPLGLQTRFGPGRHDGGAAVRDLRFQADCGCFVYSGSDHEI